MNPTVSADRLHARGRRLARVKFVALHCEAAPAPPTARSTGARLRAALRDLVIRVLGCLEAARP